MSTGQKTLIAILAACLVVVLIGLGVLVFQPAALQVTPLAITRPSPLPQSTQSSPAPLPSLTPSPLPTELPSPTETAIPPTETSQPCPITQEGGLITEIKAITSEMPAPGTNGFAAPTLEQMAAWESLIQAAVSGDLAAACGIVSRNDFPYAVIQFTDIFAEDAQYVMLRERAPIRAGWGTYVLRPEPDAVKIVLEVPHPKADWNTEVEAAELFRKLNARALLVAGAHRCANDAFSICSGVTIACGQVEPYRVSDVAHSGASMFQAAHEALLPCGKKSFSIQLHGNDVGHCPDIFISNGTKKPAALSSSIAWAVAEQCRDYSVDLADGDAGECEFTGGGVQAVYSNGCSLAPPVDVCSDTLLRPFGREQYISIEQSLDVRKDFDCLENALIEMFNPKK